MTAPRVKLDIDATREKLAGLGLGYAVDALDSLMAEAVRAELPAHVFLDRLLEAERSGREERRIKTMLKTAKIPTGQTLENFDFAFQPAPMSWARARASRRWPPAPGCATPR